jgi:hypothetical protein
MPTICGYFMFHVETVYICTPTKIGTHAEALIHPPSYRAGQGDNDVKDRVLLFNEPPTNNDRHKVWFNILGASKKPRSKKKTF